MRYLICPDSFKGSLTATSAGVGELMMDAPLQGHGTEHGLCQPQEIFISLQRKFCMLEI